MRSPRRRGRRAAGATGATAPAGAVVKAPGPPSVERAEQRSAPQRARLRVPVAVRARVWATPCGHVAGVDSVIAAVRASFSVAPSGLTLQTAAGGATAHRSARGRDRPHDGPNRERRVSLRLSEVEFALLVDAARVARMTPSGYLTQVSLAVATGTATPGENPLRQLLGMVVEATSEVARLADALAAPAERVDPVRAGVPRPVRVVLDRLDDATLAVLQQMRRKG